MSELQEYLNSAAQHDAAARQCRVAAGRLLASLREEAPGPVWIETVESMGLDLRTALMLVELAAGGRVR